jgi:hypothetical protein
VVQEKVLEKVGGDRFKVLVVWVPMLADDSREAALKATTVFGDKRVSHFWDPNKKSALTFGKMMQAAFSKTYKVPKGDDAAWDVYLVFDAKTKWRDAVPVPEFWMHQLRGVDEKLLLDGEKVRESVVKLLKEKESK